jgi:hypothetical protein
VCMLAAVRRVSKKVTLPLLKRGIEGELLAFRLCTRGGTGFRVNASTATSIAKSVPCPTWH